jgi:2-polyprenyl-6-methoxyphenol hydroxylase-like FAD-dependent oxidoreductase
MIGKFRPREMDGYSRRVMTAKNETEVLVVGAGPVGLLTALLLARRGVQAQIIDKTPGVYRPSDACLLHPATLELLDKLNVTQELLNSGNPVHRMAFYEGQSRGAELDVTKLDSRFPFLEVLPKSTLKELLERRLEEVGLTVRWNHRLAELTIKEKHVEGTIEHRSISAKGYVIPEMDWEVDRSEPIQASYLVGADGAESEVAQLTGIDFDPHGEPESYVVCEVESDWPVRDEVRIILDPEATSVLWPLPGNRVRWSFQLNEDQMEEFPFKERSRFPIEQPGLDQANRQSLELLVRQRAPWFTGSIGEVDWSIDAQFSRRLATRFGQGRCWLVGDAAHGTNPVGMQSMNCGFFEAEQLANGLAKVLRENASLDVLEDYSQRRVELWKGLLGLTDALDMQNANPWIKSHRQGILTCLPAQEHEAVLKQLVAAD